MFAVDLGTSALNSMSALTSMTVPTISPPNLPLNGSAVVGANIQPKSRKSSNTRSQKEPKRL